MQTPLRNKEFTLSIVIPPQVQQERLPVHSTAGKTNIQEAGYRPTFTRDNISSPVVILFWQEHLKHHPDCQFAQLILTANWFRGLVKAKTNMISAREHPEVISEYILDKLLQGQLGHIGLVELAKQLNIHLNLLGAIPKKGKPCLIMDLSSLEH